MLKLLWLLVFPLFAGLRGLWRPGRLFGRAVDCGACAGTVRAIDRLRVAANAGRIHGVYLTDDLNAAMVQTPSYGIFGGLRNELWLGLPLMVAMDEPHFTSVLAHEIGHLARRHGSFGARIYGMRPTLDLIVTELAERRRGSSIRCCCSTARSRRGSSA